MRVHYKAKTPLVGIGMVPWNRLGPERWFEDYCIGSFHGWDISLRGAPYVFSLNDFDNTIKLPKANTQRLIENEHFQQLLLHEVPTNAAILTYKPVAVPESLQSLRFLSSDQQLSGQLENKRLFRQLMENSAIPFPPYVVYERSSLQGHTIGELLLGRQTVILQDEILSGGKGTFVVRDNDSLEYALNALEHMPAGRFLVVSDYIERAHERSVQAVVTRHGVFVGPLQKQIIANPILSNLHVPDGDRFCGAEISDRDEFSGAYSEIKRYALQIGKHIQKMGYKGIFSVDCLVADGGRVYVLEINPRITGITPLLTMLYREDEDIPFYLLHTLELLNAEYEITDVTTNPIPPEGSLLILHSHDLRTVQIREAPRSGLYDVEKFEYVRESFRLANTTKSKQALLQQYIPPTMKVKPGGRLMTVYMKQPVLTNDDELTKDTLRLLHRIQHDIKLNAVSL